MKIFPRCLTAVLMLVFSGLSASVEAEQKSLKAIISWEGEGRVFQVAPGVYHTQGKKTVPRRKDPARRSTPDRSRRRR